MNVIDVHVSHVYKYDCCLKLFISLFLPPNKQNITVLQFNVMACHLTFSRRHHAKAAPFITEFA